MSNSSYDALNPLNNFSARQVSNGWVINVSHGMGYIGTEFVFASLPEMADWLRVQVEHDVARKAD